MHNLSPIDQPLDIATKQYTDDVVVVSPAEPSAANAEIWIQPDAPGGADIKWTRWSGSQAEYDALGTYSPYTLYVVV